MLYDLEKHTKNYWNVSKTFRGQQNSAITVYQALTLLGAAASAAPFNSQLYKQASNLHSLIVQHGVNINGNQKQVL